MLFPGTPRTVITLPAGGMRQYEPLEVFVVYTSVAHVLTDPEIRSMVERLVKQSLERALRGLVACNS
jgi:hypothetical protein